MLPLEGQLVRIDGDLGVSLKPSVWKKPALEVFITDFHTADQVHSSLPGQNTMLRYHHLSLQTLHCLKNWENIIFTPFPVIEVRRWFKITQICKNLFSDLVGFASRLNALENSGWVRGETSLRWHEQWLAFQKHKCVRSGKKWQRMPLVLSNRLLLLLLYYYYPKDLGI